MDWRDTQRRSMRVGEAFAEIPFQLDRARAFAEEYVNAQTGNAQTGTDADE